MRKNLKLFSGVLIASLISNTTLSNTNFFKAEARSSQHSAVVNNSSDENNSSTSTSEKNNDTINKKENANDNSNEINNDIDTDTSDDTTSSDDTSSTNILEALNSDEDLEEEDIANLSAPLSYSSDFVDELKVAFPDFEPLRKLSPLYTSYTPYLDVINNEIGYINPSLNLNPKGSSIYGDQNECNILIKEIPTVLQEINDLIKEEYNSTIFSLMPTMMVFNDAFNILSLKYNSIVESNYKNQITLDMLLSELKPQLFSLLSSINDFKEQLPELITTLNELVDNNQSSNKDETDESLDEDVTDKDNNEEDITNGATDSNKNQTSSNNTSSNGSSSSTNQQNGSSTESNNNTSSEEEIDPEKVTLYFGEDGQELTYEENEDKFYEINPDDPKGEELIEYSGEVTTMTLAEYLAMELYFDADGNELIYDEETDEYLIYDADNDEYLVYEGDVTTMTMEEYLKEYY